MRKKSPWLSIIALLAFMVLLLVACGSSGKIKNLSEQPSSKTSSTFTPSSDKNSRFTCEEVTIADTKNSQSYFKSTFIITDNLTGIQYLYAYRQDGYSGGPAIVELGSTVEPTYTIE